LPQLRSKKEAKEEESTKIYQQLSSRREDLYLVTESGTRELEQVEELEVKI